MSTSRQLAFRARSMTGDFFRSAQPPVALLDSFCSILTTVRGCPSRIGHLHLHLFVLPSVPCARGPTHFVPLRPCPRTIAGWLAEFRTFCWRHCSWRASRASPKPPPGACWVSQHSVLGHPAWLAFRNRSVTGAFASQTPRRIAIRGERLSCVSGSCDLQSGAALQSGITTLAVVWNNTIAPARLQD